MVVVDDEVTEAEKTWLECWAWKVERLDLCVGTLQVAGLVYPKSTRCWRSDRHAPIICARSNDKKIKN